MCFVIIPHSFSYVILTDTFYNDSQWNFTEIFSESPEAPGMAFLIGMAGREGDIKKMTTAFETLQYAVFPMEDPSLDELQRLVYEASNNLEYPLDYKNIVFYLAGPGGIDPQANPYILGLHGDANRQVHIEEEIIIPFDGSRLMAKCRLFFFDIILSDYHSKSSNMKKPPYLQPRSGFLIAFSALKPCSEICDDQGKGGIWTYLLHDNLIKLGTSNTITSILDRTFHQLRERTTGRRVSYKPQESHYVSCVGPIYLDKPGDIFQLNP